MGRLKPADWRQVEQAITPARLRGHGLPDKRRGSVVIGTFNIRDLGSDADRVGRKRSGRTPGAWSLLARTCARFDLLAVQEVLDDLAGIRRLRADVEVSFGRRFEMLVSDIAGARPGGAGDAERLVFLYDPKRIAHTELASEVTADRSTVSEVLVAQRVAYTKALEDYAATLVEWEEENERRAAQGKRKRSKPWCAFPTFLTFIRPPHVGSFRVLPRGDAEPIDLLAVNAHLLYGDNRDERLWEFLELVEWLALRAKYPDSLYAPNLLLLGDCNLETDNLQRALAAEQSLAGDVPEEAMDSPRDFLRWKIRSLNKTKLTSRSSAEANFPLLDVHPRQGVLRTNARHKETYDQIGIFLRDPRLPDHEQNEIVSGEGDAYDYGVFRFTDLLAEALEPDAWAEAVRVTKDAAEDGTPPGSAFPNLASRAAKRIISAVDHDVSDHLPAWIRLPIPGT